MANVATFENGAEVLSATSYDDKHPPPAMLDPRDDTFYATTGMFPQEFVIKLGGPTQLSRVKVAGTHLRSIDIERAEGPSPSGWERVAGLEFPDSDGRLHAEAADIGRSTASFLKIKLMNGWGDFATVHHVAVEGAGK